jgi:LysR family pca operon transcriptional activator
MPTSRHLDQRLKVHHFRCVEAIASHGTILKAATTLCLTQPALSKSLREAETILGAKLFERHSRGVRPTMVGAAFAETARRMLAELRRLDETLDVVASPLRGTLALGVLPVAASGVLPGVLARVKASGSEMRIRLEQGRTEELLPLLASSEIDLIVGRLYQPATPDGFEREALWSEPMSILARARHPIFESARIEAEQMRRYDLVLPTMAQRMGQEIEHLLEQLGLTPNAAYRSSSAGFIREMLFAGDFIAIMPRLMMVGDLLRGSLRFAPMPLPPAERPAGLIRRRGQELPSVAQAFVATLRAYVKDLASQGLSSP